MEGFKTPPYNSNHDWVEVYTQKYMKKDTRISLRLSKEDKREFYKICDMHGLCPSKIMERWIHRFNLNAKKTNIQFGTVVKSLYDEMYADYEEYKKSGNMEEDIDE